MTRHEARDGTVGFTAETFSLASLDDHEDPFLAPFLKVTRWWRSISDDIPSRQDIGFQELRGWHDRLIVSDLPKDGNIGFRIVGYTAQEIFGGLIRTGGHFADLPNTLFPEFRTYFRTIREGGRYGRCTGVVPFENRHFLPIRVLDLPARNSDGDIAFLYSFFLSSKEG